MQANLDWLRISTGVATAIAISAAVVLTLAGLLQGSLEFCLSGVGLGAAAFASYYWALSFIGLAGVLRDIEANTRTP